MRVGFEYGMLLNNSRKEATHHHVSLATRAFDVILAACFEVNLNKLSNLWTSIKLFLREIFMKNIDIRIWKARSSTSQGCPQNIKSRFIYIVKNCISWRCKIKNAPLHITLAKFVKSKFFTKIRNVSRLDERVYLE